MTEILRRDKCWWRAMTLLAGMLFLASMRCLAVQMTAVSDTVYRADGTPAQGVLLISWPAFMTPDGSSVAAGTTTVTIGTNGAIDVPLAPNAGASPQATYYTVVYHLSDGTVSKEYWVVPLATSVTIADVRSHVVPAAVAQQGVSAQYLQGVLSNLQGSFLQLQGGTLTGALNLSGDPSSPMQAATKEYVDAHAGSSFTAPQGLLYTATAGGTPTTATSGNVAGLFGATVYAVRTATRVATAFTEGTAGASIIGTSPATDIQGTQWIAPYSPTNLTFASGGGVTMGPGPNSQPAIINVQTTNNTITYNNVQLTPGGGYFEFALAMDGGYTHGLLLQIATNGNNNATLNDVGGGGVLATGTITGLSGTITATIQGSAVTVTGLGLSMTGTIPSSSPTLTNTFVGFNPNPSAGGSIGGITVVGTGIAPQTQSAAGSTCVLQADGSCGLTSPNVGAAIDGNGHVAPDAETQYATDGNGNTTIACQEDRLAGTYDPRCSRYAGGIFGATPAAAALAVSTQMACDLAQGKVDNATVRWPQGKFPWDGLTLAPGSNWEGSATALGGTQVYTPYNNHQLAIAPGSWTVTCSDGKQYTDGAGQTHVAHFTFAGCLNGCPNAPGDSGTYHGGGAANNGIDMQSTGGSLEYTSSQYFGGFGQRISGQDTKFFKLRSYSDLGYYYDPNYNGTNGSGQPDGWHGSLELFGTDIEGSYAEVYGRQDAPTANNYHHITDILTGGGFSQFDHLWPQLGPVGIAQPYGAGPNNIFMNTRVDFTQLEGIWSNDSFIQFHGGVIDGACAAPNAGALNTSLAGACDPFTSGGIGVVFDHFVIGDNPGYGASHKTADYFIGYGTVDHVTGVEEKSATIPYNQAVDVGNFSSLPVTVTGPQPNVSQSNVLVPGETAAANWTGFLSATPGEDIYVAGGNPNVTIVDVSQGGSIFTCAGANIPLGTVSGWLHFKSAGAELYGSSAAIKQVGCAAGILGSETVTYAATPAFSGTAAVSTITLSGNVTGFTIAAGGYDGQQKTLTFCNDATGGYTVTPPANVRGFFLSNGGAIGAGANKCSTQMYHYSTALAAWLASDAGVVNE